jgi:hypothetical protein
VNVSPPNCNGILENLGGLNSRGSDARVRNDSHSPFVGHEIRLIAQSGASVSPIKEVARCIGTEKIGLGSHPDSSQVEPIGVPTCLNGYIALGQSVGMEPASFKQQHKIGVVEMNQRFSQRAGILSPAMAVSEVGELIHAPRVVEERKKSDDIHLGARPGREPLAVFEHSSPVHDPMVAAHWKRIILEDFVNDRSDIQVLKYPYDCFSVVRAAC